MSLYPVKSGTFPVYQQPTDGSGFPPGSASFPLTKMLEGAEVEYS